MVIFGDISIRLFRVSFAGESGFEINVPSAEAQRVWDTLRQRDVTPYGTDAMHVLRAEKGFIIVGQETDGTVTADDVGLGWTIGGAFSSAGALSRCRTLIGRIASSWSACCRSIQLWFWRKARSSSRHNPRCPAGHAGWVPMLRTNRRGGPGRRYRSCHLLIPQRYFGPWFRAGARRGRPGRIGSELLVPMPSGPIRVSVADPIFLDKSAERLKSRPVPPGPVEPLLPPVRSRRWSLVQAVQCN